MSGQTCIALGLGRVAMGVWEPPTCARRPGRCVVKKIPIMGVESEVASRYSVVFVCVCVFVCLCVCDGVPLARVVW